MHGVAEKTFPAVGTAWHCCLEFYSVSTRLPPEFRLRPSDAARLLQEEILDRMAVHDLPASDRASLIRAAAQDGTAGGRIYDSHIAEVARAARADVVVTDNRRHFLSALRYGLRIERRRVSPGGEDQVALSSQLSASGERELKANS